MGFFLSNMRTLLSNPGSPLAIGFWLNHERCFCRVMVNAPSRRSRFLLRIRYNTARIDPGAQNPDPGREDLELGVVARSKPLESQRQDREKESFHTVSFRSTKRAHRCKNTWYTTTAIIKNPQDRAAEPEDDCAQPLPLKVYGKNSARVLLKLLLTICKT